MGRARGDAEVLVRDNGRGTRRRRGFGRDDGKGTRRRRDAEVLGGDNGKGTRRRRDAEVLGGMMGGARGDAETQRFW